MVALALLGVAVLFVESHGSPISRSDHMGLGYAMIFAGAAALAWCLFGALGVASGAVLRAAADFLKSLDPPMFKPPPGPP